MNKNMIYVALFAVLCTLTGVVVGAGIVKMTSLHRPCSSMPPFSEKADRFMKHGHGMFGKKDAEGMLDMLSTKLELTQDQQSKVKVVLDNARQQIDEIGKNVRKSIGEIRDKGDKEIMDILTPEQQQKFTVMLDEFKKRHEHHDREGKNMMEKSQ